MDTLLAKIGHVPSELNDSYLGLIARIMVRKLHCRNNSILLSCHDCMLLPVILSDASCLEKATSHHLKLAVSWDRQTACCNAYFMPAKPCSPAPNVTYRSSSTQFIVWGSSPASDCSRAFMSMQHTNCVSLLRSRYSTTIPVPNTHMLPVQAPFRCFTGTGRKMFETHVCLWQNLVIR